jgi:predicted lipid-binding transport protein (Tim44 family)
MGHEERLMRRTSRLIALLAALALVLAPALGFAKAGGGASMGSRGTRTYSAPAPTNTAPTTAQPMQRSLTPQAPPSYTNPGLAPGMAPQLAPRSSFMSGLMGGLIGAGIGGLLFGGGLFHGIGSFGGFLGFILQMALLFFVGRWLLGLFLGRRPAMAGGTNVPFTPARPVLGGGAPPPRPVAIGPADYKAFEQLLQAVQTAWSQHDLSTLRMVATPEMVSYFGEQLAEQTSRNERNVVSNVKLEQGDLSEAWSEDGRDYATVAMKFSMVDVTVDAGGRVVAGDAQLRTMTTEIWTFLRAPGGHWVLSAIQQVR